jgi:hypothetical protein
MSKNDLLKKNIGVKSSFLTYHIHAAIKDPNHLQQMGQINLKYRI